jgi:ATP-dependent Lhr-like helicase
LARLDPEAIEAVRQEAWPLVRDEDELHDALCGMKLLTVDEGALWRPWFDGLVAAARATTIEIGDLQFWIAAESWPALRALFPQATAVPQVNLPADLERTVERGEALADVLRGRLQVCGPVTSRNLAQLYGLPVDQIDASLEALEGGGIVLRGQFEVHPVERDDSADVQWCDRRLLARIHRRTMDSLRRRIKPVSPEDYVRFLARHHRLTPDSRWSGHIGVREAVTQLQGFDLPAGLWESAVLAARVEQYDPQWLDQLFLAGEVTWGRLRSQHRNDEKKSRAAITRAMPISLILRSELGWLVPPVDGEANDPQEVASVRGLSSRASLAFETLRSKGALFFVELAAVTELLPTELEEALRELAAAGLVTSDAFTPIRGMVAARRSNRHRQTRRAGISGVAACAIGAPSGRWSCFPGHIGTPVDNEHRIENWCRLLLRRYGVVFRDLLARESAAPSWRELVYAFRRLELRGDVRGGRFVSGVAGGSLLMKLWSNH